LTIDVEITAEERKK